MSKLAVLLLLGLPLTAFAQQPTYDIVLDLDETIIYTRPTNSTQKNFLEWKYEYKGETFSKKYLLSDGAQDFIQTLAALPNVRVSFYSSGDAERNIAVLNQITLPDGRSAKDIAYKILSRDAMEFDMEDFSNKKNLEKNFANLNQTLIVDDASAYIKTNELSNQIIVANRMKGGIGDLEKAAGYISLSLHYAQEQKTNLVAAYQTILTTQTPYDVQKQGRSFLKAARTCGGRVGLELGFMRGP